jgi:hypothetical protein
MQCVRRLEQNGPQIIGGQISAHFHGKQNVKTRVERIKKYTEKEVLFYVSISFFFWGMQTSSAQVNTSNAVLKISSFQRAGMATIFWNRAKDSAKAGDREQMPIFIFLTRYRLFVKCRHPAMRLGGLDTAKHYCNKPTKK